MHLTQIELSQYRCFQRLVLDLDPRVTVLIGNNASGKSSALEGIAAALDAWFLGLPEPVSRGIPQEAPRQVWVSSMFGERSREPAGEATVRAVGEVDGRVIQWERHLKGQRGRTNNRGCAALREISEAKARALPAGEHPNLPVLALYGTGRLWVQKRERMERLLGMQKRTGSVLAGYSACLEPASDHKLFTAWMAWRETALAQRSRQQKPGEPSPTDPLLEAVTTAAGRIVPNARRLYYSIADEALMLELDSGEEQPFELLSDGTRNLVAIAADIAWRAARLNPHLGARAPQEASGVVLIDELDLHLHPDWQRSVLGRLLEIFPNIQLVVTTHSPQVVSSAKPEWLRVLQADGAVERVDYSEGRDTNALLRSVFGVADRPTEVLARIQTINTLLGEGALSAARAALCALEAQLGPNDDQIVSLRWELHDLEVNGATGQEE
ncbi:AAA family ATPase [Myxococcota bacterium]|nr:AAA family ATPase [Myxococcota bacterium]